MKKTIISSIAMLMMLIITSCIHSTDPYAGLVKKNNSTYLTIGEKSIPVDSGIGYKQAERAFLSKGKICFIRKIEKKINWQDIIEYRQYVLYDGTKIFTVTDEGTKRDSNLWAGIILIVVAIIGFTLVAIFARKY
ncbi:MAG: hypothetical protein WCJ39_05110 [bacterium]